MDALFKFRSICSMIPDQHIRYSLEAWLVENISTFQVEARIDRADEKYSQAMEHHQKNTMERLIGGLVEQAQTYKTREWLQGDHRFGTIITRRIDIIGRPK